MHYLYTKISLYIKFLFKINTKKYTIYCIQDVVKEKVMIFKDINRECYTLQLIIISWKNYSLNK